MTDQTAPLLIVYNADSGILNALFDAVRKQVLPQNYPCSLCALTYGAVSMHGEWRKFLKGLGCEVIFHHRDNFHQAYPAYDGDLPAILLADHSGALRELVGAAELDAMVDLTELVNRVEAGVEQQMSRNPDARMST
ncbi:hypothetical protein [Erythrobacter sp. MTPC3]|uniref:hypothetical protein n=1 Tax=Erythrobacter sp. MTPC3 TaxID=3056564 RepID=UPI0036F3B9AC